MVQWVHYYIIALIGSFLFKVFNFVMYIILLIDKYTANILDLPIPQYIKIPFIFIYTIIKYLNEILFWILLSILSYIFTAWLIVLFLVPAVIIVFVFFIPVPIPLKSLILEFVPPFKDLTEADVLPLMLRILYIFIDGETFANKFKSIGNNITNFTIKFLNDSSKILFPFNPLTDIEKFIDIKENFIDTDSDYISANNISSNIINSSTKKNKYKYDIQNQNFDEYYKNTLNIINNERQNCIIGNTIEINSGMSIIDKNIINAKNILATNACHNNAVQNIVQLNLTMNNYE